MLILDAFAVFVFALVSPNPNPNTNSKPSPSCLSFCVCDCRVCDCRVLIHTSRLALRSFVCCVAFSCRVFLRVSLVSCLLVILFGYCLVVQFFVVLRCFVLWFRFLREDWRAQLKIKINAQLKTSYDDKTREQQDRTGKTRPGKASNSTPDDARQGKTRQDKTRQDETRQDKTRQDKTRQDKTRRDKTWYDNNKTITRQFLRSTIPASRCYSGYPGRY